MDKAYTKITFKNNQAPALDADNLNSISTALDTIDNRAIQLNSDLADLNACTDGKFGNIKRVDKPIDLSSIYAVGGINGNVGETINITSSTTYSYVKFEVALNDKVDVKIIQTTSATYPYYAYTTDANNVIIGRYVPLGTTEETITISGRNVKYLYVLCRGAKIYETADISVSGIIDIQTQIDSFNEDEMPKTLADGGLASASVHNASVASFNFVFMTDTHSNGEFLSSDRTTLITGLDSELSNKVYQRILDSGMVSCGFHGGDIISSYNITKANYEKTLAKYMQSYNGKVPVYLCKGNHECNHETDWYAEADVITPSQYAFNTLQSNLGKIVVNPNDVFGGYYYIDFDAYKIRCIVLNAYPNPIESGIETSFGESQINWVYESALDLSDKDDKWGVIAYCHTSATSSSIRRLFQAFINKGTSYSHNGYTFRFDTDAYGTFIAMIHGHTHTDSYDSTYYNLIGVDRAYSKINETESNRCCVDIFSITPNSVNNHKNGGKIYETRIGRGTSREFTY